MKNNLDESEIRDALYCILSFSYTGMNKNEVGEVQVDTHQELLPF